MALRRRSILGLSAAALAASVLPGGGALAAADRRSERVLAQWTRLVLELVRHTATYSPPVASRAFACLGITAWEALAAVRPGLTSLAGQVGGQPGGLGPVPAASAAVDEAAVLHAALAAGVGAYFANTGPTGQRAMAAMQRRLGAEVEEGLAPALRDASLGCGQAIAGHVVAWSAGDGGARVENLGFPDSYALREGPGHWVPTTLVRLQQTPLLPGWGDNRPFAMPSGDACGLPPPPEYSETPGSAFHAEATEVYEVGRALTDEQKAIARFWSDDPMLSPTPPGHWIAILMQIAERDALPADRLAEGLARVGIAVADAFIACWHSKFQYDLLRPVTYIRRVIDPKWEPLLITPPFPEYPSGHSTQSAAAAAVLESMFGAGFAFDDATHEDDGIPARHFAGFDAAAREAALSRLYGGIHFRAAIERGLDQGRCVGAHAVALKMRA